ncbi:MAG: sensor histidine kinase [Clostridiaceae bacterium]
MLYHIEDRDKILNDIIDIVKLISLLLIGLLSFIYFVKRNNITFDSSSSFFGLSFYRIVISVFVVIYCIWAFISLLKKRYKNRVIITVIESLFFLTMITIFMVISKNSVLQYKYLYIFVILLSTLEIGMKFGLFTVTISSIIILTLDIVYLPSLNINELFQNDIIIVSVFILVSLPLGYYVEIEKLKLKENRERLYELSNEVKEENVQRKKFEKSLLKNQACYNLLIEQAKDAIIVHRNNNIIFTNNSAAQLLGFNNKNDLINKSIFEFQLEDEKEDILDIFQKLYDGASSEIIIKGKVLKNNNEEINVENTSAFFTYEGEPTILTILHDITYEKEVERLQDDVKENIKLLNESREFANMMVEFIANISHELKTPLNLIYSSIQLLDIYEKDRPENNTEIVQVENRRKYLGIIKQNCLRLIRLINNLLDISKTDSGFLKLNPCNQDIISIVETITTSVVPYVESKGISIIFDTEVEEKVIACDSDKIERVVLNILSNAIKFTDSGGCIFVNIIERNDSILISIKDTGVGIPEEKISSIFDRFMQVDKTLRRNREGTGIGLSIVKSFVEMHHGKIEVYSKLNEGTNFIIHLPNIILEECDDSNNLFISNINTICTELSDL